MHSGTAALGQDSPRTEGATGSFLWAQRFRSSVEMKNLLEVDRQRAVVIIGQHQVFHMRPPSPADLDLRDLGPQLFRFDLDVSEEPVGFAIEEDRVVARGVSPQRL